MRRFLPALCLIPFPALAEVPKVVTDIAPIDALVAQVMGELGAPALLVDGASDPHAMQLRPSQAAALENADLIVWVGPDMTPWLDHVVDGLQRPEVSLVLMEAEGLEERKPMFGAHEGEEHHGEAEGEEHHEGEEEHHHGEHDPHIWLDPKNAQAIVAAVAVRLIELDPEHAVTYAANAAAATNDLDALDAEIRAILAPAAARPTIVFHDAYAHFAGRYGLTIVGALAEGDAADPGAAAVADLRALIETQAATCVFTEALHSDKLILSLTDGLGVPVGRLDPEGTTLKPGPEVYPAMMRALATAWANCGT